MRILHVLHNSVPLLCGYSIRSGYIVNIERAMGWDPHVVTSGQHPNGDAMTETIAGTEYRRTAAPGARRLPFAKEWALMKSLERQVEGAVRDHRPDVIHAHSPVLVGLPALRVARGWVSRWSMNRDLWENASVDGDVSRRALPFQNCTRPGVLRPSQRRRRGHHRDLLKTRSRRGRESPMRCM